MVVKAVVFLLFVKGERGGRGGERLRRNRQREGEKRRGEKE